MVSQLLTIRTDIVTALTEADIKSVHYMGETLVPPVVVVIPDDPYLTNGEVFGTYLVRLRLLVVGAKGTNKAAADALDEKIETIIDVLSKWDALGVSQPGQISLNGSQFLGTVITLETEIKI